MKMFGPNAGVTDAVGFDELPPNACPAHAARNVRFQAGPDQAKCLVSRSGLARYVEQYLPGAVQAVTFIALAAGTTFTPGEVLSMTGGYAVPTSDSSSPSGCVFFVHPRQGLSVSMSDPDTVNYPNPRGGPVAFSDNLLGNSGAAYAAGASCMHDEKTYGIGDRTVVRLHYFTYTGGNDPFANPIRTNIEWSVTIEDKAPGGAVPGDPANLDATAVVVFEPYVIVAANGYLHVYAAIDIPASGVTAGDYLARVDSRSRGYDFIQAMCFTYRATTATDDVTGATSGIGNFPHINVAFRGKTAVGGPVSATTYSHGAYKRSAISEYAILASTPTTPLQLLDCRYGQDTSVDASGDWRSDLLEEDGTRGRLIYHMAAWKGVLPASTTGTGRTLPDFVYPTQRPLFVAMSNTGFGGAAGENADGSTGYKTIVQLRANDLTLTPLGDPSQTPPLDAVEPIWFAVDPWNSSRKEDWQGLGTMFNDLPYDETLVVDPDNGMGIEPSHSAVALDSNTGNLWVAGRVIRGANVYRCDGNNGAVFSTTNVGGLVPVGCMAFDKAFNRVVVGTERNTSWTGSSGRNAHLVWVDAASGEPDEVFDLGKVGVKTRSLAVNAAGWVAFSTFDYVS